MEWEILSARWRVEGGCYSITVAYDLNKVKWYIARYCHDPISDPIHCGSDRSNKTGLGHAKDLFEATEICKRDAIANILNKPTFPWHPFYEPGVVDGNRF
jgi:hypothetical protein